MKNSFTVVKTYTYLPEAEIAKGHLESEGVQAWVDNENIAALHQPMLSGSGGIRLRVESKYAERALKILDEKFVDQGSQQSTLSKVFIVVAGLLLLGLFVAFTMAFFTK